MRGPLRRAPFFYMSGTAAIGGRAFGEEVHRAMRPGGGLRRGGGCGTPHYVRKASSRTLRSTPVCQSCGPPPRGQLRPPRAYAKRFGAKPAERTQHAGLRARRLRPADVCDVESPTHDNTQISCRPPPRGGFGPPMAMPSSRGHAKFRWLAASPKRKTAPRRHAAKRPVFAERTIRRPVRCGRGGRTTDSPRPARTPFRPAGGHTPRSDDDSGRHRARRICSRPPRPRRRAA